MSKYGNSSDYANLSFPLQIMCNLAHTPINLNLYMSIPFVKWKWNIGYWCQAAVTAQVNFRSMWLVLFLYLLLLFSYQCLHGNSLRKVNRVRKNTDLSCWWVCMYAGTSGKHKGRDTLDWPRWREFFSMGRSLSSFLSFLYKRKRACNTVLLWLMGTLGSTVEVLQLGVFVPLKPCSSS